MTGLQVFATWDALAFFSSLTAGVFLLIRRHMLRGGMGLWHDAPRMVQASLSALAIYMGGVAVSLLCGWHADQREAAAYFLLAVSSVVMVVNLDRNGRRDPSERHDA